MFVFSGAKIVFSSVTSKSFAEKVYSVNVNYTLGFGTQLFIIIMYMRTQDKILFSFQHSIAFEKRKI